MSPVAEPKVVPRFKERYVNEIRPALVERFGYETPSSSFRRARSSVSYAAFRRGT